MNYLITGGAGFIGSHLVELLIENNHKVVCVDDLSSGYKSNLSSVIQKIDFYEEKIVNFIKQRSKQTRKRISLKEVEQLITKHHKPHEYIEEKESKKPKNTVKSSKKSKKIRKK